MISDRSSSPPPSSPSSSRAERDHRHSLNVADSHTHTHVGGGRKESEGRQAEGEKGKQKRQRKNICEFNRATCLFAGRAASRCTFVHPHRRSLAFAACVRAVEAFVSVPLLSSRSAPSFACCHSSSNRVGSDGASVWPVIRSAIQLQRPRPLDRLLFLSLSLAVTLTRTLAA